jgi:alpha-tubulin suppressor-like RCC1 family protein
MVYSSTGTAVGRATAVSVGVRQAVAARWCVKRRIGRSAVVLATTMASVLGTACTQSGSPTLEPHRIHGSEWDSTVLRVGGLAPELYLETGPDGLRTADDLRVTIAGVDTTTVAVDGASIDVRLTAALTIGSYDLDVRARGRSYHLVDALEVYRGAIDDGGQDAATTGDGAVDEGGVDGGAIAPRALAAGASHTCAVGTDSLLRCFGHNNRGQLGALGSVGESSAPLLVEGLGAVVAVDAGDEHTCAITSDGSLWCWGRGASGRLGLGDTDDRPMATRVGTAPWLAIATGATSSCGIQRDGSLWCWGSNVEGQLGLGTTGEQQHPERVGTGTRWASVSIGRRHACAIQTDGALWCWGFNAGGVLGDGSSMRRTSPVPIAATSTWTDVDCGESHTCAIRTDNTALCWGSGSEGRLGAGPTLGSTAPLAVSGTTRWLLSTVGDQHSCGLAIDGTAWCWGRNNRGALGLGDTANRDVPVMIAFATPWLVAEAGAEHTCAFNRDGALYCWGLNDFGQVGSATPSDVLSPTRVALP